jgi:hypothetical protein
MSLSMPNVSRTENSLFGRLVNSGHFSLASKEIGQDACLESWRLYSSNARRGVGRFGWPAASGPCRIRADRPAPPGPCHRHFGAEWRHDELSSVFAAGRNAWSGSDMVRGHAPTMTATRHAFRFAVGRRKSSSSRRDGYIVSGAPRVYGSTEIQSRTVVAAPRNTAVWQKREGKAKWTTGRASVPSNFGA